MESFAGVEWHMSEKMQASWRLREQQRKQAAADEARRRAVEVSEISFPSLASSASVASGWGVAPLAPAVSAAAERWSSGAASVASYVTPAAPSATATIAVIPKRVGIHASISAEVRRTTTTGRTTYWQDGDGGDGADGADGADGGGWTEVSSSRSNKPPAYKSKSNFNSRTTDDYDDDEDYFGVRGNGSDGDEEENR